MENTAPPQQTTSTPIEPSISVQHVSTPATKSSNKLLPILLIIVLVLAAGMGGYILGTQRSTQITEKEQVTYTPSPATSAKDPTANWKIYTNSTFGFTFKYPENWTTSGKLDSKEGWLSATVVTVNSPDNTFQEGEPTIIGSFDISVLKTSKYSLKDQISGVGESLGSPSRSEEKFSVNGINGTIVNLPETVGNLDRQIFLFERDNIIYSVSLHWKTGNVKEKEIVQQIFSTFRFTDTKSADSWLKYKNAFYGYTIEYPSTGEGPTGSTIACGKNITEDQGSLVLHTDFENYFGIFSVKGYQTVKKYLDEEKLSVSLVPITIRGADEAYKVSEANGTSLQYIMRKGTSIVRVDKNNGVLEGCFPTKDWDITKSFYFE